MSPDSVIRAFYFECEVRQIMNDKFYMSRAIELAKKGIGRVSPNPLVGAVVVRDGKIISEGYHEQYGGYHAERNALNKIDDAEGATMYVTLEPCCHHGKTPPCTDIIIEKKLAKVVIGSGDPNPLVFGEGIKKLQEAGIEVVCDFMKEECDSLNEIFFHYIKTARPFVLMKYAMTLDGKIATVTGESKWVSGEISRSKVHEYRNCLTGICVGIGTVLKDDPLLTCRLQGGKNPIRIVCDSHLRLPTDSKIANTAKSVKTIVTCLKDFANSEKALELENLGITVIGVCEKNGKIDLDELMNILGDMNIDSILLEGGGTLNWAFLEAGIVNKVHTYVAPKIFGGKSATSPVSGPGVKLPADAFRMKIKNVTASGEDILIESEVLPCSQD